MSQTKNTNTSDLKVDRLDAWFNKFIENLEADKFLLKEDLASEDTKSFYNALINDDVEPMMRFTMNTSQMYFIERITKEYLQEFKKRKINFKKLALDLGNSKVLAWVELDDDDEQSEDGLIMAEAKVNAKFHADGFHISTTIVEERDRVEVPAHYHLLNV